MNIKKYYLYAICFVCGIFVAQIKVGLNTEKIKSETTIKKTNVSKKLNDMLPSDTFIMDNQPKLLLSKDIMIGMANCYNFKNQYMELIPLKQNVELCQLQGNFEVK